MRFYMIFNTYFIEIKPLGTVDNKVGSDVPTIADNHPSDCMTFVCKS